MTDTNRALRVFLCHSSKNKAAVRELYKELCKYDWIDPWLDEEKLLPGQDWHMEIEKAVVVSDVVIALLSNQSITQEGYVQRELKLALDVADEKPEGTIFIIPLRLDNCSVPRRLRGWQYVDYFPNEDKASAFERVKASLKLRVGFLGLNIALNVSSEKPISKDIPSMPTEKAGDLESQKQPGVDEKKPNGVEGMKREKVEETKIRDTIGVARDVENITEEKRQVVEVLEPTKIAETISNKLTLSDGMEFMRVPAGTFIMGSAKKNDERPQHVVDIPYDYWMARFPVTNKQYRQYVDAKNSNHPVIDWEKKSNHPVTYVSLWDCMAYCRWLSDLLKKEISEGLALRLPTEAEWEKAARGIDGREYPWGNKFDTRKCNASSNVAIEIARSFSRQTTSVYQYSPQGDSPFGCADMAGNVWEWTHSLFKDYPYDALDGREIEDHSGVQVLHIIRGGCYYNGARQVRCTDRAGGYQAYKSESIGFRLVIARSL